MLNFIYPSLSIVELSFSHAHGRADRLSMDGFGPKSDSNPQFWDEDRISSLELFALYLVHRQNAACALGSCIVVVIIPVWMGTRRIKQTPHTRGPTPKNRSPTTLLNN
ncbi:hypothetical protein AVEN_123926-1 [Araneus ventricosus]|uniref:Uncharacterized protein n=1 Tax=Araneus ventricosus TaxID=182803 RepID=A0A4Y2Q7P4_ARAVE|nr:hypothetical protein AVEN_123926-1 [Araneus ventricosus]